MRNKTEFRNDFAHLSFCDDIYFKKEYAQLYGEPFLFQYNEGKYCFKTIAVKNCIENTPFYDIQSPYGYNGFYTNTNDEIFIQKALNSLKIQALKEKIIAFFIRFHPFDKNFNCYAQSLNYLSTPKKVENIKNHYNKKLKNCIKQNKMKLKLEFSQADEALHFKFLYEKTMLRNKAENFYFFDENYFKQLYNFKEYKVLKASLGNEILAYASFFLHKDFSYYHLSANTLESHANAVLLDFFFEYASQKACKFCILGGGFKKDDSLFDFKQKFSTLYTYFNTGGIIFDEQNYKILCENFHNPYFLKYRYH